jgi:hypothetical protein
MQMSEYLKKNSNRSQVLRRRKSSDAELPDHELIHPLQKFNSIVGNQAVQRLVQANPGDNRAVFDVASKIMGTHIPVIQRQPNKSTSDKKLPFLSFNEQESVISTLFKWAINVGKLELTTPASTKDELRQAPVLTDLNEHDKMKAASKVFTMLENAQEEMMKNMR